MHSTIEQLTQYKKYKVIFSRKFGANEATVQKCVDELLIIATASGKLTSKIILTYIEATPTCSLRKIFSIYKPDTEEEKLALISQILEMIPILIGSNNHVYIVQRSE